MVDFSSTKNRNDPRKCCAFAPRSVVPGVVPASSCSERVPVFRLASERSVATRTHANLRANLRIVPVMTAVSTHEKHDCFSVLQRTGTSARLCVGVCGAASE
jgi:hypothetical protein